MTSVSAEDGKLLDAIADSEDLPIFTTDLLKDYIDFKWNLFARKVHTFGLYNHILDITLSSLYIRAAYHHKSFGYDLDDFTTFILYFWYIALIYPTIYDFTQLTKQGFSNYFSQFWNYVDMINCIGGYVNIYIQRNYFDWDYSVYLYSVIILTQLFKLFFFFRINDKFSIITTMILTCVLDLKVFMIFFTVMTVFFGMTLNIFSQNLQPEYNSLAPSLRGIISALRLSVGDFDFTQLEILTPNECRVWWIVWLCVFFMGCLIFLNFIIAEVGESYAKVKEELESLVYKERAKMVREVEDFFPDSYKENNKEHFPTFIVVREPEA